ncbi:O-antigen translocase [Pseudoalteromonas sp. SK20]|uniref:O-antigen translocase n=1 Tax=Pseudoalteromonas sp. SK20 TaxID=1938367 RepID=UPI000977B2F7|nr:O-antigen translocase [Pseudoalteromonas sp. SK20]
MTLIKTSLLSFIATAVKLLAGLVINKAIALYVGPSGLAIIGQFQNMLQLAMTASQGAINAGVTKYTAEIGGDGEELPALFSTAFKISVTCSIIVGLLLIVFSNYAATNFLNNSEYRYVFITLGFTIVFYTLNSLLLSIVNGLKEVPIFIGINITQSIYSLIFTTALIYFFGLKGALLALVTNQSIIFVFVLWKLRNHPVIKLQHFKTKFNKVFASKLGKYALMSITAAILGPVSHLIIRNHLGESFGWEAAGYWQAIWYISTMYLMVITTSLSIYYLPRLSEINNKGELRKELISGYKIILPVVSLLALSMFALKDFIILILFSEDFQPMKELFLWQLVGDVLKIIAWLLSYIMLAKAMTKSFMISEILASCSFVLLTLFFTSNYGLIGITYAFALNYLLYLVLVFFLVRRKIF